MTPPSTSRVRSDEGGFSLLETLLAATLTLIVTATVFGVMHPAEGLFAAEPERAVLGALAPDARRHKRSSRLSPSAESPA